LQPVGGMDRIAYAFANRLSSPIVYVAVVKELRRTGSGVAVMYANEASGMSNIEADYAICTIPLSVLAEIPSDLSDDFKSAIAAAHYARAAKIAFQADRRFWEVDHQIYGGISWTSRDITQIWYPSSGFHAQKGIILGAYIWDDAIGEAFGRMTPAERLSAAATSGGKIHSGYQDEVSRGIAVCWQTIPYSQGAWSEWSEDSRRTSYPLLNKPDGPVYLAGEHLSYLTGWQEGAVLSAHAAVRAIGARVKGR
jgi:monoamine oxidase